MRLPLSVSMLPNLGSPPGRNHRPCPTQANGFITLPFVIGFVCCYLLYLFFNLLRQLLEHIGICCVVACNHCCHDLPTCLIHPNVNLKPPSTFCPTIKKSLPFPFPIYLHPRRIHNQMQRFICFPSCQRHLQALPAATKGSVVWNIQIQSHQLQNGANKPFCLAKGKMIDFPYSRHAQNGCLTIKARLSPFASFLFVFPIFYGVLD